MIRFICGNSGSGKTELLLEMIRTSASEKKKILLIVPEQEAVTAERRLATDLPGEAGLFVEVVNFTRLSDKVFREYGGFLKNCASPSAKQFLMWAALDSVKESLTYYSSSGTDKLVESMLRTVKELHTYGVTPAVLEDVCTSLRDGDAAERSLSQKLSDISLILASYDALLHESFEDGDEAQERAARLIGERHFFRGYHVFADSFYTLTPTQRMILRFAMSDADEFTMSFSCPETDSGEPHLRNIRRHFDRMRGIAAEIGGNVEIIPLKKPLRFKNPALAVIEKNLWDFTKKDVEVPLDGISLIETSDRYSEAEAVAATVQKLVRGGAKYSDIAIIARNTDTLAGITDRVLTDSGIPHYTARRKKLSASPAAALLLAALRIPAYGWRREDIIAIMKTGLAPLSTDECDLFENYINTWRIRGQRVFFDEGDFSMSPSGYRSASPERDAAVLESVNRARRALCTPLAAFCKIFEDGRATARECAEGLYSLLLAYGVPDSIASTAVRLREYGLSGEAAECLRMWDALMEVLNTLATTIPDVFGNAEVFGSVVSRIICGTDVGTIPTGVDEVAFGSAHMIRTDRIRHAIVIGAVEGEFPGTVSDTGILSDTDRVILEGCGIELADGSDSLLATEMFLFYKALTSPSETLTVIVPASSGTSPLEPSMGALRLTELLSLEKIRFDERSVTDPVWTKDDLFRLARTENEARAVALNLFPEEDLPPFIRREDGWYISKDETISHEVMKKIMGRDITLSQSRIDEFVSCPFRHAAKFSMSLEPLPGSVINPADTGTFVHSVLEEFFRECKDEVFPLSPSREDEVADRIINRHITELWDKGARSGRQKFLLRKLRRSIRVFIRALSEEFAQSAFAPWGFEQKMGYASSDSIPSHVTTLPDGTQVRLKGVIDRIDVMRHDGVTYIRIVDYKTGSKTFSLKDIYEGLNLQLLLYLFSVWKSPPGNFRDAITEGTGEIIPAGAMYFSARPGESSVDDPVDSDEAMKIAEDSISRTGVVLNDLFIIEAMDKEISGKYTPVKKDKRSGNVKDSPCAMSVEQFGKLYLDVADTLRDISENILSGNASATPKDRGGTSVCSYCDFRPVCRKRN